MSKTKTKWIEDEAVTNAKLNADVAGTGLSGGAGSALALDINSITAETVRDPDDAVAIYDDSASTVKKMLRSYFLNPFPFNGNVLTVDQNDPDADYSTIQAAISAASAGDVILVGPGIYTEQITGKAGVNLIGYGNEPACYTQISGGVKTSSYDLITMSGAGMFSLRRFRIKVDHGGTGTVRAIVVTAGSLKLSECDVSCDADGSTSGSAYGAYISGGTFCVFSSKISSSDFSVVVSGAAVQCSGGHIVTMASELYGVSQDALAFNDASSTGVVESSYINGLLNIANASYVRLVSGTYAGSVSDPGGKLQIRATGLLSTKEAGEINGLTEKASPVSADLVIIEDSAASYAKKKVQVGNLPSGSAPVLSRSITIESPGSSEDLSMFFTNCAVTVTEIRAVVRGSTPSVTWTIRHGTDRSATGAEVVTGGTTTTSQSTGSDVTSFDDPTIVADSFVWVETTAQSGTVAELSITVVYTED